MLTRLAYPSCSFSRNFHGGPAGIVLRGRRLHSVLLLRKDPRPNPRPLFLLVESTPAVGNRRDEGDQYHHQKSGRRWFWDND